MLAFTVSALLIASVTIITGSIAGNTEFTVLFMRICFGVSILLFLVSFFALLLKNKVPGTHTTPKK